MATAFSPVVSSHAVVSGRRWMNPVVMGSKSNHPVYGGSYGVGITGTPLLRTAAADGSIVLDPGWAHGRRQSGDPGLSTPRR